jgi:subtilisin family serine protease
MLMAVLALQTSPVTALDSDGYAPGRVIVTYELGTTARQRSRSLRSVTVTSVERASPRAPDTVVLELAPGQTVARAVATLESRSGVAYAEPDYWLEAAATADDPYFLDGSLWGLYGGSGTPSNPYGSGAAEAWAHGHTGSGSVHVGIIDEGVKLDHPDLAGNVWTNPYETVDGVDNDGNGYVDDVHGWDFRNDDAGVYDGAHDDHGTHVAGIVGARGGNGLGVAGVSWAVTLVPGKFLGRDGGWTSDAIRALDYMTDLKLRHGLDIVATNNSYSGPNHSRALLDAIERGGDAGILFVAAAGNGGHDLDVDPMYPAAHVCDHTADGSARGWDCIVAVANIEPDGDLRFDSNFGAARVHLGAPGTGTVSTVPRDPGYAKYDGTSMAAAHVTGAIALCRGADPGQTARQVRDRLIASGSPTASLASRTASGHRLDVAALLQRCTPPQTPTTRPVYVDDLDEGFRTFGPGWHATASGFAGHHHWVPTQASERVDFASWKPLLPVAGTYVLQAWVPAEHATTRQAAYRIKTSEGWVTRVRNQYYHRGTWMPLGTHELTTTPIVQLADKTGEDDRLGRLLAFDVVRFIPTPATRARISALDGVDDTPRRNDAPRRSSLPGRRLQP